MLCQSCILFEENVNVCHAFLCAKLQQVQYKSVEASYLVAFVKSGYLFQEFGQSFGVWVTKLSCLIFT